MSHRPSRRARRASASPLFTPHGTDRASRRKARRELAEAAAQARAAASAYSGGQQMAEEEMPPPLYGPGGRPGPASARGSRLRLPAHRMTTATASGAYPFLAEGGLGADGIYIGRDVHAEAAFSFDPFTLYGKIEGFTNPNVLLAGVIGQGKSALAKSFALRSIAFGYRVYVPCDPKGEWTPVATALGGTSIALGPGLPGKLNPLDAAPRPNSVSEADWANEIRKRRLLLLGSLARTVLGRDLAPMEHTALDVALDAVVSHATSTGQPPLLGGIASTLNNPGLLDIAGGTMTGRLGDAARDLAHALRRLVHGDLAGMFDAPSTVTFDPGSPMLTIDLSRLGGSRRRHRPRPRHDLRKRLDGVGADRPGRRPALDRLRRSLATHAPPRPPPAHAGPVETLRGLGIANLMVIHRLSDLLTAGDAGSRGRALAEGLLADCSTRIIYRQETDQIQAAAALLGLTSVETQAIAHLNRGRGLWKVAGRSFIVQHLLHPSERDLFDTDARMH